MKKLGIGTFATVVLIIAINFIVGEISVSIIQEDHRKVRETKRSIDKLALLITEYKNQCGKYPEHLTDVIKNNQTNCKGYIYREESISFQDQWGKDIIYIPDGNNFKLRSEGGIFIEVNGTSRAQVTPREE